MRVQRHLRSACDAIAWPRPPVGCGLYSRRARWYTLGLPKSSTLSRLWTKPSGIKSPMSRTFLRGSRAHHRGGPPRNQPQVTGFSCGVLPVLSSASSDRSWAHRSKQGSALPLHPLPVHSWGDLNKRRFLLPRSTLERSAPQPPLAGALAGGEPGLARSGPLCLGRSGLLCLIGILSTSSAAPTSST